MLDNLVASFVDVFSFPTLPLMLFGVLLGFIVGILPGLGGSVALALMIPFTFTMEPTAAFAFLLGMHSVTNTAGDLTSIMFGVPGEATAAAVVMDGHAMAKRGEATRALAASLMSSLIGAFIGAAVLAAMIPVVRPFVLGIGAPELFALAALGIALVGSVSGGQKSKGLLAGCCGLLVSTIGLDQSTGLERCTLGSLNLWGGVSVVAVAVGLFGIPELISLWRGREDEARKRESATPLDTNDVSGIFQGIRDAFHHWTITVPCSVIGTVLGMLPGLGSSVSVWFTYGYAGRIAERQGSTNFGRGDIRGVIGPSASGNSKEGGNLMPLVAFGLPNTVPMAVLLGAFLLHGLQPGKQMLTTNLNLTLSFVWIIVLSNVVTVVLCLLLIKWLIKVTSVRAALLVPALMVTVFIGAFSYADTLFDVGVAVLFGALGYAMVNLSWPRAPFVMGLVLGPLMEQNLFISDQRYGLSFLTRPVVLAIIAVVVLVAVVRFVKSRFTKAEGDGPAVTRPASVVEVKTGDMLLCVGVLVLVLTMAWAAHDWPLRARLFPWTVQIVLVLLLVWTVSIWVRRRFSEPIVQSDGTPLGELPGEGAALKETPSVPSGSHGGSPSTSTASTTVVVEDQQSETSPAKRSSGLLGSLSAVRINFVLIALVVYMLVSAVLGLRLASVALTLVFPRFAGKQSWRVSLIMAAVTYVVLTFFFEVLLHVPFNGGLIAEMLEIPQLDWRVVQFLSENT